MLGAYFLGAYFLGAISGATLVMAGIFWLDFFSRLCS